MFYKAVCRILICCATLIAVMSGCDFPHTVENEKSTAWQGYRYGEQFVLLHDCFLIKVTSGLEKERYALVPEGNFYLSARFYSAPPDVEEWENMAHGSKKAHETMSHEKEDNVFGVISKGTCLQIIKLRIHRGLHWWCGFYKVETVYAKIIGGSYAGYIVDVSDVSILDSDGDYRSPNQQLLKRL